MSIYEYISSNDSPEKAEYVYSRIKECILNLCSNPERGYQPNEFEVIGITEITLQIKILTVLNRKNWLAGILSELCQHSQDY
jgi:plasmid stabilization system protein ParE